MPKRAAAAAITTLVALVLLLGFRTPADQAAALGAPALVSIAPQPSAVPGTSVPPGVTPLPAESAGPIVGHSTPAPVAGAHGSGSFTGTAVEEPYGVIQVRATLTAGRLTAVSVVQMPTRGRSGFISSAAAPILEGEAISAQSANIDTVSGATYTSQAYAQSLQAALDQAGA
ncbi:MAG: FMN-binding protein [Candidatus Limnocylindrales bacterium]